MTRFVTIEEGRPAPAQDTASVLLGLDGLQKVTPRLKAPAPPGDPNRRHAP
jgi:hypothetical protein